MSSTAATHLKRNAPAKADNVALVREMYAAFARNDIAAIVERLASDIKWRLHAPAVVPYAGERRGRAEAAEFFAVLARTDEITKFVPETFIADDAHVVVLGQAEGRARATARNWRTPWVHVWTIRDGKAVMFEDYLDSAALAAAFG
ncbi:MAG: nuclear transport factor 2 family protein [Proteobacteria bacterium]|nr:nuclear transport factor 2 family protein [Pseudomonadota bacterium]